jgi:signal transduction histidine kinase
MRLRLKYLLPLNMIIFVIWAVYAIWSLRETEKAFLTAEVNALRHLAIGLTVLIEDSLATGKSIKTQQAAIEDMAARLENLDILIINSKLIVEVASKRERIGQRWYEAKIAEVLQGKLKQAWNISDHTHAGRRAIDATIGVRDNRGKVVYIIHAARFLDELLHVLNRQKLAHGVFALTLLIVVGISVNVLTYRLVIRPLDTIHSLISQSGWLERNPQIRSKNELVTLQAVVKDMIQQINRHTGQLQRKIVEKQQQLSQVSDQKDSLENEVERVSGVLYDVRQRLIRAERLAAIGQMGAALAHEFRNPLHIVRGSAEGLARLYPETTDSVEDIVEEVDKLEQLIEDLLDYARPVKLRAEKIPTEKLLKEVRTEVERHFAYDSKAPSLPQIRITTNVATVFADPLLLERALINLTTNAVEASSDGQIVALFAEQDAAGGVTFSVADSGSGIADEELEKVFEPLYTKKSRGTGLGLSVVEKIADLHHGSITLTKREAGGIIARLHIPGIKKHEVIHG